LSGAVAGHYDDGRGRADRRARPTPGAVAIRRVVLLLPDPPLPFGSAATRWYYVLLRGLVARGHRVTALSAAPDAASMAEAAALFPAPDYDLRLFPHPPAGGGPWRKLGSLHRPNGYMFGPELKRELAGLMADDGGALLHAEHHWSGWAALPYAGRSLLNVHYLYAIDWSATPAASPAGGELLRRLSVLRAERDVLRRFPAISALTPRLTEAVRRMAPRARVETVPFALDPALYDFAPPPAVAPADRPPTVGMIGSFHWGPSHSAAVRLIGRLWPEIRRRVPGARLQVVGRKAVAALGSIVGDDPTIALHENVPDIEPYFRSTDLLLYAPGRGSGMKVKILEAFAFGTPVVTNGEGAEGLPIVDGEQAGLADDDAGLIDRAVALMGDRPRAARQAIAARALLERHCGPEVVLDRLEAVYDLVAPRRQPTPAPAGHAR